MSSLSLPAAIVAGDWLWEVCFHVGGVRVYPATVGVGAGAVVQQALAALVESPTCSTASLQKNGHDPRRLLLAVEQERFSSTMHRAA